MEKNQRKYKLIKEYPGSCKIGTEIVYNHSLDNFIYNVETPTANDIAIIPLEGIIRTSRWSTTLFENYKEYYQEIIEKEYEILTLSDGGTLVSYDKSEIGTYNVPMNIHYSTKELWLECFLRHNFWKIYSVKRVSDGEVFIINDKIFIGLSQSYEIKSINISNQYKGGISIEISLGGYFSIMDIKKCKIPLFTTEDGVDIFDIETSVFEVIKCNLHLNRNIPYGCANHNLGENFPSLVFSNEESAQNYIDLMKPKYSKKDIIDLLDKYKTKRDVINYLDNN